MFVQEDCRLELEPVRRKETAFVAACLEERLQNDVVSSLAQFIEKSPLLLDLFLQVQTLLK